MDVFRDDDLKRLIRRAEVHKFQFNSLMSKEQFEALLSRMEAAEKAYLLYRNDPEVRHTPEQFEAGLAWRKASGKGGE